MLLISCCDGSVCFVISVDCDDIGKKWMCFVEARYGFTVTVFVVSHGFVVAAVSPRFQRETDEQRTHALPVKHLQSDDSNVTIMARLIVAHLLLFVLVALFVTCVLLLPC